MTRVRRMTVAVFSDVLSIADSKFFAERVAERAMRVLSLVPTWSRSDKI